MKSKLNRKPKKSGTRTRVARKQNSNSIGILGQALRALGGLGGGAVGGLIGHPGAGASTGHSIGAAVSKWLGAGDYTVRRNTLAAGNVVPAMHKTGQSVVVRHREFITSIGGSATFAVRNAFVLNPGDPTTFPWLSSIATAYQEYKFRGLVFHYVPTSGMVSGGSTALGSVMMQTSYRSNDSPPTTKVEMLNEYWANEVVPYETMAHPVECDPKENPFAIQYVRSGPVPNGDNQLLYDLGVTYVAVQGAPANTLGDIWVTYEVELKKPVLATNAVATSMGTYNAYYAGLGAIGSYFGATPTTFLGNLKTVIANKTISILAGQPGTYLIVVNYLGAYSLTSTTQAGATLTNCTVAAYDGTRFTCSFGAVSAAATNLLTYTLAVSITDATLPATILCGDITGVAGTNTGTSLAVTKIA